MLVKRVPGVTKIQAATHKKKALDFSFELIIGLVVNYGISNTVVLKTP